MIDLVYGVVINGVWYSNRSEFKMRGIENGIYVMDMGIDNFRETIAPANIDDARKFFSKASKIKILRGISFHDGIIPENPVKYPKLPIKVEDPTYDEFEEIEVAQLKGKTYFLQIVYGGKSYALMDVKAAYEEKKTLDGIKDVTPEMRLAYTLNWIDRQQEEIRVKKAELAKMMKEPINVITHMMKEGGAQVQFVRKNNRGYEVQWSAAGYTINTQLDENYRVVEAGFCVSNWDRTQSARSLVNVLNDYVDNEFVNVTRTVRRQ